MKQKEIPNIFCVMFLDEDSDEWDILTGWEWSYAGVDKEKLIKDFHEHEKDWYKNNNFKAKLKLVELAPIKIEEV